MSISENLKKLYKTIPPDVKLVAVSKTKSTEEILKAYHAGQRIFGENKVQELLVKHEILPKDIEWHMIGHLQSNKVKYIAPFVHMIHAVDSFKLLKIINKEAVKNNRKLNCLFQLHIASEETKFGMDYNEVIEVCKSDEFKNLENIKVCGVMGMASFTNDHAQIRNEFKFLKKTFQDLKSAFFIHQDHFEVISMGMSGDYQLAIEEGSNLIRVGTLIFGERLIH